jgi:hypothetical protein
VRLKNNLLLLSLLASVTPAALHAQAAPETAPYAGDEEVTVDELVVSAGQRPRGSVIGDIQPEQVFSPAEIRSFGVNSISDLLAELTPETTSGRGGAPVVLLNGRRISGMGELRDIPTEAIARVEVLPEEVALKYGYAANQKVVNFVLRQRFRATTTQAAVAAPTEGGQFTPSAGASVLRLNRDGRMNLGVKYERSDSLFESDRDILPAPANRPYDVVGNLTSTTPGAEIDPRLSALAGQAVTTAGVPVSAQSGLPALADFSPTANVSDISKQRSLLPATEQLSLNAVYNRMIFGDVSATVNATASLADSDSRRGLAQGRLTIPADNPFSPFSDDVLLYRYFGEFGPLRQSSREITGRLAATLDGDVAKWRWNLTAAYDHGHTRTDTDRGLNLGDLQAAITADDPAINPFAPLGAFPFLRDRATSVTDTGTADLLFTGAPLRLPAGDLSTSLKVGLGADRLSSTSLRAGVESHGVLSRESGSARLNVDVPLTSVRNHVLPQVGDLSANLNVAVDHLSDFGSLRTYGGGLTWTPVKPVNLIASYTDEEAAPTMAQLGGPTVVTPDSREFDFQTGQTVEVARVTGGNPSLRAEDKRTLKLGVTVRPPQVSGLSVTANYFRTRSRDPIAAFPTSTAAIESAFPDRFLRDADGALLRVDARPINFQSQASDQVRWGFNFSRQIGKTPQPTPEQLAAMRVQAERRDRDQPGGPPSNRDGEPRPPGGAVGDGPRGPGGPRGFGRGFGAARATRLQVAVYHTVHLREEIVIRDGLPPIDLLNGGSISATGGEPEQEVEVQAGLTKNGLGARLSAKWRSGTTVDGGAGPASQLRFSDLTTVNLRLFADLGLQRELVQAAPFFRGARLSLSVTNLFNERLDVRDATGATPIRYQPDYLDPLGRSVQLTFRKQFFPPRPPRTPS